MEEEFVRTGGWKLGWNPTNFSGHPKAEDFYNTVPLISDGDRIAIKRRNGEGGVDILHIGIVRGRPFTSTNVEIYTCIVDWANKEPFEEKVAGLHGWVGSGPFGPYSPDDQNRFENFEIERIFSL